MSYHRTKAETYKQINPLLKVHRVYETDTYIDERKRIMFTRFRLSSHGMKIETGRWARIDRENRSCDCEEIQDEYHVLFNCIKSDDTRSKYSVNEELYNSLGDLMNNYDTTELVHFICECLQQM